MFPLKVSAVTTAEECVTITGFTNSCVVVIADKDLNCGSTTSMSYANEHVKLPAGWFPICGKTVYSYVPTPSTGGSCSLGRLTVFVTETHPTGQHRETALGPECNRRACSVVKSLNTTSQAIHAIGEALGPVREAALENRAAIDYLLLKTQPGMRRI